ncbi:uncharacterized protein LOC127786458 [Diospyros lotus]|uniref:uncharacterized protein LOC127786458 n=1 Tax=Diospyros lotus TaxID=55363 RepID=UPI00225B1C60|nr:uncharacterized protein LOC127786458 [Diospyros lotus]
MAGRRSSDDWLPPGWTVEVKVRKNGKKDKCYIDSSTGLKFFSKPEVFRYLNNIETCCSKSRRKRRGTRKLSAINSAAVVERVKLPEGGRDEQIIRDQSSKLVGGVKNEKILDFSTGRERITSASFFNLPEAAALEQREKSNVIAGAFHLAQLPGNEEENRGDERLKPACTQLKSKKTPDLPRRTSKRLAGIEVGAIPELKPNTRAGQASGGQPDEAETSKARNLGDDSAAPEVSAKKKHPQDYHMSILNRHTEKDSTDNKKADEEPGPPLNFPWKDMWMDPCIEFAIKTLTGAMPIEDENKPEMNPGSVLELPSGDSWGDPCIEFAVKTLTGAIPVVDDLEIQYHLQEQLDPSGTKRDKSSSSPDSGNLSLLNSADAGPHFGCEDNRDEED